MMDTNIKFDKALYMEKGLSSFRSSFGTNAALLDKRNKARVLSNICSSQVQARFRALHPNILFVEIGDSYFGCQNHLSTTYNKDHRHGAGCSLCIVMHSHHENLCDNIRVVIEGKGISPHEANNLKQLINPLMLEVFDFVPVGEGGWHMFEEYDQDHIDSREFLPYKARE